MTPEEAKISRERLEEWTKSDTPPSGGKLGPWIYEKQINFAKDSSGNDEKSNFTISLTDNAVQKNWRFPTGFLCSPKNISNTPLEDYLKNLQVGKVFNKNKYGQSEIIKFGMEKGKQAIIVQSYNADGVKNFFVSKITYENNLFVHTSIGSYFGEDRAEKYYTIAIGEEWTGGDVFDDYC